MDNQASRKLTVGSYYLILDQGVNYAVGALFWFLLAKLLAPTAIGQIMVVTAFVAAVLGFAGYGAQVTISRYVAEYNARNMQAAAKKVLNLGLKIGLVVSIIAAIAVTLISDKISTSIYNDSSLASLIAVAMLVFLPSQTVMSCFNGAFQGSQRMKYTTVIDAIYQASRIAIAILLVMTTDNGTMGVIVASALASIFGIIIGYFVFIRKLFNKIPSTSSSDFKRVLNFSSFNYLAIGISTVAAQLAYLLLGTQSFGSVALFGISSLISGMVGGIVGAVGRAIIPTTSEELQSKDKTSLSKAVTSAFRVSLMVSGFIYILLMIAPEHVLSLLSREYVAASIILRILVLSSIIASLATFIGSLLNGLGKPRLVAEVAIISSIIVVGFSIAFIPVMGLSGAAISVFSGSVAGLLLSIYFLRIEKLLSISYKSIMKPAILVSFAILVGYWILSISQDVIISLAASFVLYVVLTFALGVTTISEVRRLTRAAYNLARL